MDYIKGSVRGSVRAPDSEFDMKNVNRPKDISAKTFINKDEDNSRNILNNENYQASSKKFRQIT